uniref:Death domain-containing protein n=1 Tax=Amphimedon queenslandica TaxID=400682 RepID=A0A1X7V243_AMPQE
MAEGGESAIDVFGKVLTKLSKILGREPPFTIVTAELNAKGLIADGQLSAVKRQGLTNDQRGNEVAEKLKEKIGDSDNPNECVLKICDVFESDTVDYPTLKGYGAKMRKSISIKKPTPKKFSGDDEPDGPQGGYMYILDKAKQHKWTILTFLILIMAVAFGVYQLSLSTTDGTPATSKEPTTLPSIPPQPTATQTNPNEQSLSRGDTNEVLKVLNEAMFGPVEWRSLGLSLGLYIQTLDVIGRTNGDSNDYLEQTVKKWLQKKDKVTGTTWDDLIRAVKSTGENAAAEKIRDIVKKH